MAIGCSFPNGILCNLAALSSFLLLFTVLDVQGSEPKEKGWLVAPHSPAQIQVRFPLQNDKYYRGVYGKTGCNVLLSCTIDIPKTDGDCSEHYVKVTDGSSGSKAFCGKTEFKNLRASEGLRHMFLVVKSSSGSQVLCNAKCAEGDEGEKLGEGNMKRKQDLRCVCGLQNKDDRIVGGEDALADEFPWQAALVYPGTRQPFCGASLINNQFVLTAAHCFKMGEEKTESDVEVLLHATLLDMTKLANAKDVKLGKRGSIRSSGYNATAKTDADEKSLRFPVQEILAHPMFNEEYDFDYALVKLEGKIDLSSADSPTPVCLPPANVFDSGLANWIGKMLTVTGWGFSDEYAGGSTRALQKVEVPYMDYEECKDINPQARKVWTDRMICAGYDKGKKDACQGDSGGPLTRKLESKQFEQVGIVSWGSGCARAKKPGFYSRVTEMMQWIHLHTTEHDAKWCKETK